KADNSLISSASTLLSFLTTFFGALAAAILAVGNSSKTTNRDELVSSILAPQVHDQQNPNPKSAQGDINVRDFRLLLEQLYATDKASGKQGLQQALQQLTPQKLLQLLQYVAATLVTSAQTANQEVSNAPPVQPPPAANSA